jgi:hypothetical protein
MDHQDREAIEDLFRRIGEVERRSGPRDRESAAFIRALIEKQPSAPYYMAQTIIVQQQALEAAQSRLEELEGGGAQRPSGGGFLDSLFGGGRAQSQASPTGPRIPESRGAWGSGRRMGGVGGVWGGGFLAGAAQTAMGVAGGVVLGNMLADMLSPDQAAAAGIDQEAGGTTADPADAAGAPDTQVADAGDFGSGDFDLGDF